MGVLVETDRELECDLHLTFIPQSLGSSQGPSFQGSSNIPELLYKSPGVPLSPREKRHKGKELMALCKYVRGG